jgi:hypothetical protein
VTFADHIKMRGGAYQKKWHYTTLPVGGEAKDFPKFKMPTVNSTGASEKGIENNTYYQKINVAAFPKGLHTYAESYSIAMRYLLHLVGDAHQPLHSASRLDSEHPKGDAGGNMFSVPSKKTCKNLHSVWDKVLYEFPKNPRIPFKADTLAEFDDAVLRLMIRQPVESIGDIHNLDPKSWLQESYKIASEFAYKDIKENEPLSEEYITKGRDIAEKQLVLAGYRLAELLKTLDLDTAYMLKKKSAKMEKERAPAA